MSKRWIAGMVSTAALVAAVVIGLSVFRGSAKPEPANAITAAGTRNGPAPSSAGVTPVARLPAATGRDAPVLERATRLSELEALAMRPSAQRGQALTELQQAMLYCEAASFTTRHPSSRMREKLKSEAARKRFEWHANFVRTYCDAAGVSANQLYAAMLDELPPDDLLAQTAVLDGDPTAPDPLVMEHAARLADQRLSPAALEKASEYLLERGQELAAMKAVPAPVSVRSPQARAEAQRLVVRMVTCEVRGGCGPDGLNTILWCGDCNPGASMDQHWRQQYSPEMIAFARAVAARLGQPE